MMMVIMMSRMKMFIKVLMVIFNTFFDIIMKDNVGSGTPLVNLVVIIIMIKIIIIMIKIIIKITMMIRRTDCQFHWTLRAGSSPPLPLLAQVLLIMMIIMIMNDDEMVMMMMMMMLMMLAQILIKV